MPKKFFWIKLKDSFFKQLAIKKLRKVAGGDTFVIIYLKMMLLSMNNEGKIVYECNDGAEFAENLALDLDEQEDNVNMTLAFLKSHKLIEFIADGEAFLPEVVDCIGSETESAKRMRKMRNNKSKASHCDKEVTQALQDGNKNVTLDIEKDIEKEIDIDAVVDNTKYIQKGDNPTEKANNSYNPILAAQNALNLLSMSQFQVQLFVGLYEEFGEAIYQRALEKAAKADVRNFNYVEKVAKGLAAGIDYDDKPKTSSALDFEAALKEMKD